MPEIIQNAYLTVEIEESVAIIWLNQIGEKVNKIAPEMIESFEEVIDTVENRPEISAAILISRKKDFVAGADIERFLTYAPGEAESIGKKGHQILNRVENSKKPYVAAIHGACMGAGLEIALACHSRVITESNDTILALPEVKLGLLPGGGGTQRLPKLIGLEKALEMMLTGKNIYPSPAIELGLASLKVPEKDLLNLAKMEASRLITAKGESTGPKLPFFAKMLESFSPTRKFMLQKAKEQILKKTQGNYPAPLRIIECVAEGFENGMKKGLEMEARYFDSLIQSPEARQLIYLFFAMTELKKNPWQELASPVDFMGVIGDKRVALGIIPDLVLKEIRVKMKGDYHSRMDRIKDRIQHKIKQRVHSGTLTKEGGKRLYLNFIPGLDYGMLENVDMVIDLETGGLEQKEKTLSDVESMTEVNSVFAISSSYLTISEIVGHSSHPEKVIGVRYCTPDAKAPFVEIIPTPETNKSIIATMVDLAIKQGKAWILVKDRPGFYAGRLQAVFLNEALGLLYHGGDIKEIDSTLEKAGFAKGPFKMIDEIGFEETEQIINTLNINPNVGQKPRTVYSLHSMIAAQYTGQEEDKGFYEYDQETGKREKNSVNEEVYEFWQEEARKTISTEEIYGRLFYEVINEAAYCLENQIIYSAKDGDLGAIFGVGFPAFLGGPFRYMDSVGISVMVSKLKECEAKWGKAFKPPKGLEEMVGKTFYVTQYRNI